MSYQTFAYFYDKVMDQTVYESWLSFVETYQPAKKQVSVLELACGTGIIASKLAQKGYQVTGLDLSDEMLALAYERSQEDNVSFLLLQGDMRELEDIGTFDLVTCFSDSLCYLTDEEDLLQTFKGVNAQLDKDGVFLFDVHSLYQMTEVFPGYQYIYQDEEDVFLWESFEGELPHSVEHLLTFFVADEDGRFERMQEVHEERSFPIATYTALLQQAGFKDVEVRADFGNSDVTDTSTRWFFVCKK